MPTEPTVTGQGLRQLFERGSGTPEQAWDDLASFFNASFLHAGKDGLGIHAFAERLTICEFLRKVADEKLFETDPDSSAARNRAHTHSMILRMAAQRIQGAEHHHAARAVAKDRTDS